MGSTTTSPANLSSKPRVTEDLDVGSWESTALTSFYSSRTCLAGKGTSPNFRRLLWEELTKLGGPVLWDPGHKDLSVSGLSSGSKFQWTRPFLRLLACQLLLCALSIETIGLQAWDFEKPTAGAKDP